MLLIVGRHFKGGRARPRYSLSFRISTIPLLILLSRLLRVHVDGGTYGTRPHLVSVLRECIECSWCGKDIPQ